MPLVLVPLLDFKLAHHLFLQLHNPFFVLDPDFSLKHILLVIELFLQLVLLIMQHLCKSLLDKVTIGVKFFFSFLVGLGIAARRTVEIARRYTLLLARLKRETRGR